MSNLQIGAKISSLDKYQLRYDCICMYTPIHNNHIMGSPTIGLSFRSLVIFCIFLLVVKTKLERLVPGSKAAVDL